MIVNRILINLRTNVFKIRYLKVHDNKICWYPRKILIRLYKSGTIGIIRIEKIALPF